MTRNLLKRLAMFGGANGLAQLFSVVYYLLLARWLLPENYGVVAGCYAAATLTAFMINWGMDTWLVRQAATDPEPRRLVGSVLKLKALLGIPWGIGIWFVLVWIRPDYYLPTVLAVVLLDTWLDVNFATFSSFFNATHQTRTISALVIVHRSLRLLSAVGLILIHSSDVLSFVTIRLAFTAITVAATLIIARPAWRGAPTISLRNIWQQALPYAQSELLAVIYGQIDLFLLTLLASKAATGSYAPPLSVINTLVILLISTFWLFVPYLTQTFQKQPEKLKREWIRMMEGLLVIGCGLALFLVLFGPWIVDLLLGHAYQISGSLIQIMSPILIFKSISMGCAALLVAGGKQRERLLPQLISAGANLLLNLWAIPHWGPAGAAMVYLTSEAILTTGYAIRAFVFLRQTQKT